MADELIDYRYTRAFIVEGVLAREGQEITLLDEPTEACKVVLTGAPDPWLADASRIRAVGLIAISRISVAGVPPPPSPKPVRDPAEEFRLQRKNGEHFKPGAKRSRGVGKRVG